MHASHIFARMSLSCAFCVRVRCDKSDEGNPFCGCRKDSVRPQGAVDQQESRPGVCVCLCVCVCVSVCMCLHKWDCPAVRVPNREVILEGIPYTGCLNIWAGFLTSFARYHGLRIKWNLFC